MSKLLYTGLAVAALVAGFALTRQTASLPQVPDTAPPITAEQLAQAYKAIRPIDASMLDTFFHSQKDKGLLFVYRSDCKACDAQWKELSKMSVSIPLLAISADDSVDEFANALVNPRHSVDYVPYYVSSGRLLSLRTWLREHRCCFTGALPFIALTNGKGRCVMAWQGFTAYSAIEGVAKYVKNAPRGE